MSSGRRTGRRMMSEINVVPYIDVMLVLLIIFMITAPLVTQGVRIELPQAPSEVIPPEQKEPLIVTVDAQGQAFIDYGAEPESPVDAATLIARVMAVLKYSPGVPVLVRGDRNANYGDVVVVMTYLQDAGVASVGLVTEVPADTP